MTHPTFAGPQRQIDEHPSKGDTPLLKEVLLRLQEINGAMSTELNRIGAFRHRVYTAPDHPREAKCDGSGQPPHLVDQLNLALGEYWRLAQDAARLASDCERIA